jgi:hypothetical protein
MSSKNLLLNHLKVILGRNHVESDIVEYEDVFPKILFTLILLIVAT